MNLTPELVFDILVGVIVTIILVPLLTILVLIFVIPVKENNKLQKERDAQRLQKAHAPKTVVDGPKTERALEREKRNQELQEINRFSKGLFSWVGYDVTYIAYENRERVAGETSWNFWSLLKYSMEGFTSRLTTPTGVI